MASPAFATVAAAQTPAPLFCSRGEALAAGTIVFGAIGASIGAFITSERWTPIDSSGRR